ncbi:MAG TPA: hypothetical protein VJY33_20505, partial [Isosphaeraceae bacterium]|nr:hypothetical protein [Isosphaeraceae bacterium]
MSQIITVCSPSLEISEGGPKVRVAVCILMVLSTWSSLDVQKTRKCAGVSRYHLRSIIHVFGASCSPSKMTALTLTRFSL